MKKALTLLAFLLVSWNSIAQTARSKAVELRSEYYQNNGNQHMTVYWPKDTSALSYEVFKRNDWNNNWSLVAQLNASDSFVNLNYSQGQAMEIWVKKKWQADTASGYIYCGANLYTGSLPSKQTMLLILDSNYVAPLSGEINRLIKDLEGEYWNVVQHVVQRSDSVQTVKRWIEDQWQLDSLHLKSVLLLGHVPVPYSGNINPDGHPDHQGAWPADVYYVTFDRDWTDNTVNTSSASRSANHNVPGDNKFDQDYTWPAKAKIPLGRIDLYNMPLFGNDTFLTKRYLDKNHLYRMGKMKAENRALIDDNFGFFYGEAFAADGWRCFAPIFDSTVYASDYFSSMHDSSFLFSYGCGGGTYTSAGGIGNSSNFASDSLLNPFTMLFGSYFGDWDNQDNFLRAPLASKGWGLANAWAGRPMWMFQYAALNLPIGIAAMLAQNSWPDYDAGYSGTYVHIALLGDPTLRLFPIEPPSQVKRTDSCTNIGTLSWVSVADTVVINVYSSGQLSNSYWIPAGDSSHTILSQNAPGNYEVEVRNMSWMKNASGNFRVYSQPVYLSMTKYPPYNAAIGITGAYNCIGDSLHLSNLSSGRVDHFYWSLNGHFLSSRNDTVLVANQPGPYTFELHTIDSSGCFDSATIFFRVFQKPGMDSLHYAVIGQSIPCDGDSNIFALHAEYSPANSRLLFYWGDSTGGFNLLAGSPLDTTHVIRDSGTFTAHFLLNDSSGVCWLYDSAQVTVYPKPAKPLISPGASIAQSHGPLHLRSSYTPGFSYDWGNMGNTNLFINPGDSAHKVNVSFGMDGIYFISLQTKNTYGCMSDTAFASVNVLTGLSSVHQINLELFPNPGNGPLHLRISESVDVSNLEVINTLGQSMRCQVREISDREFQIDIESLPPGNYHLRGNAGGKVFSMPFTRN